MCYICLLENLWINSDKVIILLIKHKFVSNFRSHYFVEFDHTCNIYRPWMVFNLKGGKGHGFIQGKFWFLFLPNKKSVGSIDLLNVWTFTFDRIIACPLVSVLWPLRTLLRGWGGVYRRCCRWVSIRRESGATERKKDQTKR